MTSSGGSWRVAGRLARREIRRHPWRHLLVTGLILVPVLAALTAFSGITTYREVERRSDLFSYGDLTAVRTDSEQWGPEKGRSEAVLARDLGLPDGTRTEQAWSSADWLVGDRQRDDGKGPVLVGTEMLEASPGSVQSSRLTVERGRLPRTSREILLTEPAAASGGWSVGDTVMSARSGRSFEVVGLARFGTDTTRRAAAVTDLPESYWNQSVGAIGSVEVGPSDRRSVDGLRELTAWVPDANFRHDLLFQGFSGPDAGSVDGRVGPGLTMAAAALCLIVAIVASAALAISSRRQLRSIGLLSTVGVDPATVRRTMLLQGAIPGLAAGVGAVVIGGAAALILSATGVVEHVTHVVGSRIVLSVGGSAIAVALGVGAGIAAAWQPARTSSRIPTLAALAGRRPLGPVPTGVPVAGAIAWAGGACLLLVAFGSGRSSIENGAQPFLIIGGVAAIALGGVGLAPAAIALLEPLAGRFRGTWRMGLRGLARHRMQSAATVAAIGVVLALPVGLLTARNGLDDRDRTSTATCCVATTQATIVEDQAPLLLSSDGGAEVAISGALRSDAAADVIAGVQEVLGPDAAVIRSIPIVDQTGGWKNVAAIDEALAPELLPPWAAEAIADGKAVALDGAAGPVSFTAAGETARFDTVGPPNGPRTASLAHLDSAYLVARAAPVTKAERTALRLLDQRESNGRWVDDPTLEQIQDAVASDPNGTVDDGVFVDVVDDGPIGDDSISVVDQSQPDDEWNRALLAMAVVSSALALLVLTITLSLRAVDGETDRQAAFAAGVAPVALRHQRAFEGVVLALLGAALAIPLGWIPVTAARIGADGTGAGGFRGVGSILSLPGWAVIPMLLAPALLAAVLWTAVPAAAAAVRTARHRDPVDELLPRF